MEPLMRILQFGTVFAIILILNFKEGNSECCYASANCNVCDDCTPPTPYCAHGRCNIFGCNCDGGCRTGTLCPIGTIGQHGQKIEAGPNCVLPFDRFQPYCAISFPNNPSWNWVHACNTRGKRSVKHLHYHSPLQISIANGTEIIEIGDINGDGKISFEEGIDFVMKFKLPNWNNRSEIIKNLSSLDIDKNGILTLDEID